MNNATVFVIDDDKAVRDSLRWLIGSVGLPVELFISARAFLDSGRTDRPGCIVVDVRMPGISGLDLQDELVRRGIDLPLIVITAHGDVRMAVRAMKAGAIEFIEKPINDQQFLDAVQKAVAKSLAAQTDRMYRTELRRRLAGLTARERQVLDLVVAGRPNKVVAHELAISEKTVEAHRARIMIKMAAKSFAELVREVMLAGRS